MIAAQLLLAVASVVVHNDLPFARTTETVEIPSSQLTALGDLNAIHVFDGDRELVAQTLDVDGKRSLIFQTDVPANGQRTLTLKDGAPRKVRKEDFRVYGRFVRERFDDFAWENDRVAHRMYGAALETWQKEPLTSSAVDVWLKRTRRLVINDWYMVDNYHSDMGEGVDDYSAGLTRGCGGTGIWANGQLFVPKNFVDSRVLANGPIRVLFELVYEPFDVNGVQVSQVLRVSLDAGSQLNRFESFYRRENGGNEPFAVAIGLKKVKDEQMEFRGERGWLAIWEPMEKNLGMQGLAIVLNPSAIDKLGEDKLNNLLLLKPTNDSPVSYWAGFAWDRAGLISTSQAWTKYVDDFAAARQSPITVTVK